MASAVAVACGASESLAPTPLPSLLSRPLELHLGPQILSLTGFAISNDPDFPPCSPIGVPRAGTGINAHVKLSKEGREWVARSTGAGTDLELRFEQVGDKELTRYRVTGTIRGSAADEPGRLNEAFGVRFSVDSTASDAGRLEGEVPLTAFHVRGRVTGRLRFSDSSGASSTCTAILLFLRPLDAASQEAAMPAPAPVLRSHTGL